VKFFSGEIIVVASQSSLTRLPRDLSYRRSKATTSCVSFTTFSIETSVRSCSTTERRESVDPLVCSCRLLLSRLEPLFVQFSQLCVHLSQFSVHFTHCCRRCTYFFPALDRYSFALDSRLCAGHSLASQLLCPLDAVLTSFDSHLSPVDHIDVTFFLCSSVTIASASLEELKTVIHHKKRV
jgi:hypothetical protein